MLNSFSFIGNVGGYLGLFLGYAALNIPELLQEALNLLYTNWNARKRMVTVTTGLSGERSN